MIVRDSGEVVLQSAHAWLAARLSAALPRPADVPDWEELLNATAQHDHGWIPKDLEGSLDGERPLNFMNIEPAEAIPVIERSLRNGYAQSVKCGLLVSKHMEFLYAGKDHPEMSRRAKGWKERRESLMDRHQLSEEWLELHYDYLLWADTLSLLIVCSPSAFTDLLGLNLRGCKQRFHRLGEERYRIEPWPFEQPELYLNYAYFSLSRRRFSKPEQLAEQLSSQPLEERVVTLVTV